MDRYDPERAPDPEAWLATSEAERMRLIMNYHVATCRSQKQLRLHAAVHHGVESWLATGFRPAQRALEALLRTGLARHDALHRIHAETVRLRTYPGDRQAAIGAALEQLARAP
jgi:hypothetical protein